MVYPKAGKATEFEVLLANLRTPSVRICFDEVHERYAKVTDRMPAALNSIRERYMSQHEAACVEPMQKSFVIDGMSASTQEAKLTTGPVLDHRKLLQISTIGDATDMIFEKYYASTGFEATFLLSNMTSMSKD